MSISSQYIFILVSIHLAIFNWVVSFLLFSSRNYLHILDTNILSDTYAANIFC